MDLSSRVDSVAVIQFRVLYASYDRMSLWDIMRQEVGLSSGLMIAELDAAGRRSES